MFDHSAGKRHFVHLHFGRFHDFDDLERAELVLSERRMSSQIMSCHVMSKVTFRSRGRLTSQAPVSVLVRLWNTFAGATERDTRAIDNPHMG